MATISLVKEAVSICCDAGITSFLWGERGVGKSSLVKQLAEDRGWGFVDYRCAQIESADLRGLPDKVGGCTAFLPPVDLPVGGLSWEDANEQLGDPPTNGDFARCTTYYRQKQELQPRLERGVLFLDELNRAQQDVLQAAFQLVLDRRVGMYVLPAGWNIVAAGNPMEGYIVSGFDDPAFLDRFCHLTVSSGESTVGEWVGYMAATHGNDAAEVIEFASQNVKHLDGELKGEQGFSVQPSRRSWDSVTRVIAICRDNKYSEAARLEVIAGLVGRDLALSFTRYSCPIKPSSLLADGVQRHHNMLKKLDRGQLTGLMWGLISYVTGRLGEEAVADVCLDFADFICHHHPDKDIVVAFCRALLIGEGDVYGPALAAVISNPKLADMISKFNKQAGNKKNFVDRLVERPALQKALSAVAWGSE